MSEGAVVLVQTQMKAAVLYGKEDLQIESVAVPSIGMVTYWYAFKRRSPVAPTSKYFVVVITPA